MKRCLSKERIIMKKFFKKTLLILMKPCSTLMPIPLDLIRMLLIPMINQKVHYQDLITIYLNLNQTKIMKKRSPLN